MIVTHMPWKLAVLTAAIIAAALGAYYVIDHVMGSRGWEVRQGMMERRTDTETGRDYVYLKLTGGRTGEWFRQGRSREPAGVHPESGQELVLTFWMRTRGVSLEVTLKEDDGEVFRRPVRLIATRDWVRVRLPVEEFRGPDGTRPPDPWRLMREVKFHLVDPVPMEAELQLTTPRLELEADSN